DADAPRLVANEQLGRFPGRASEPFERGMGEVAQRELTGRPCRQPQQARSEAAAPSALERQEPVGLEGLDEAVGRGAREARRGDDLGEASGAAFDRVEDQHRAIQHADVRRGLPCYRHVPYNDTQFRILEQPIYPSGSRDPGEERAEMPMTLAEKVWERHVVHRADGEPDVLYVDLHLVHEVTSPQAFDGLRLHGRTVRRPDLTIATMDHNVPTTSGPVTDPISARQMDALRANAEEF